ncbi:MAG: hypothetical protein IKJ77_02340 [Firmicutes bacterium]|nr:hypothetical protein [Bacillota bacterium]
MKQCFEILGVGENATIEQIQAAYERKVTRYSNDVYLDDPKYAKKKLKELKQAYKEACRLAGKTEGISSSDTQADYKEKPTVDIDEDPEEYMKQLYHKHLGTFRRMGDISGRERQRQRYINKYGRSKANKAAIVVTLLVVAVFSVMIGVISCDFSDLNEAELKTINEYRNSEIQELDREIAAKADEIYHIYKEKMEFDTGIVQGGEDRGNPSLPENADYFAQTFWKMETIGEVSNYLAETYEGYPSDGSDTTVRQLDTIMLFYEFPTFDDTRYTNNPYTGEEIWEYTEHISFLLDAYEHI